MKKKTTIYDIARELNITVSTVSRALNGVSSISEATTKAVLETAKKLNYSPNKLASSLKSGKTYVIGVIVPSMEVHFFSSVIHSIEDTLKGSGYQILLCQSNEKVDAEKSAIKTLLEAQVDGIIASMSLETEDVAHFEAITKQGKPLVLFDRTNLKLNVPSVTLDDYRAGYMVTEHLIKNGFKKIGFITTSHQIKIFKDRLNGYLSALNNFNLPVNKSLIVYDQLSIADGEQAAARLVDQDDAPDAIIAGDDFTALGVINKLKELKRTDIGVIGFANETFSAFITPTLSSIDQQANLMGRETAQMFLKLVSKKDPSPIGNVVVEPILVERESSKRILK